MSHCALKAPNLQEITHGWESNFVSIYLVITGMVEQQFGRSLTVDRGAESGVVPGNSRDVEYNPNPR